jgi:hypothetical protein
MIYSITLNPALDWTLWVENIKPDDSNRVEREERYAGGKGIDVSRVFTTLGVMNKALGFIGGFTGERTGRQDAEPRGGLQLCQNFKSNTYQHYRHGHNKGYRNPVQRRRPGNRTI